MPAFSRLSARAFAFSAFGLLVSCENGPLLSKLTPAEGQPESPDLGQARPDGPKLGALLDRTPVFEATSKKAPELGYLHAGALVPRSERSHETSDCVDGWYHIAPVGYVCTEDAATLDLEHPTLKAMALPPKLDAELPYVYGRTIKVTGLFDRIGGEAERGVELAGRLAKNATMAIVGSWTAPDETREPQMLGMKLNGQFVRTEDLTPAGESKFSGVRIDDPQRLPLAYVLRRGVHVFRLTERGPVQGDELPYHQRLHLTGRYRSVGDHQFWAIDNETAWVRQRDVTFVHRRHEAPDFARTGQKWIDISLITGTAVLYEGARPVYATLVSVGRDRLGDPKTSASTERGTFRVVAKHLTRRVLRSPDDPEHDAPWALELENGQWLLASTRHDRFGIEHSDGDIEVAPQDGAFIWKWATPELPPGWHGIRAQAAESFTLVNVRK